MPPHTTGRAAPPAVPGTGAAVWNRPACASGYDRRVGEHRLVYSTDGGDLRERDRERRAQRPGRRGPQTPDDGVVRVFREKGGRGGKVVTVVRGLPGDLAAVARDLKRHCGSGGAVKDGAVEIQGDHRAKVVARLEAQGHRVKAAGG